ncbi:unnamed protein product [Phaedon cochleariae]|uniref:Translation initiation factor eIF2B subunit delta n=1 Tax=Phaedon cochleariae TaxID=80249 RepID=A0A9P0DNL3_PHACE|nr:unnamed protein product [Phaedon cochleariae]
MDKKKEPLKKEKVAEDGLTKKERRALKVQVKKTEIQNVIQVNETIVENKPNPEKEKQKQNVSHKTNDTPNDPPVSGKLLSDKELRKLEWEKKLTDQKTKELESVKALSKAELKAKRREQQESQRSAKTSSKVEPTPTKTPSVNIKQSKTEPKKSPVQKQIIRKTIPIQRVQLVQHLYIDNSSESNDKNSILHNKVHPAFVRLGTQYSNKNVLGSNARCLALLAALKQLVDNLQTPPKQEFCRYLETVLKSCTNYLQNCRPLAVSMINALRNFNLQLTQIDTNLNDNEKRIKLQDVIDIYINDDIRKAGEAISMRVREKISDGDVILTYGCSSLIRKILLEAHKDEKKFEVIIVDSRPLLEGKEMLRRLVVAGIKCSYVLINALSYVMNSVTKVILGAHALLTNGYVMSRIGTAQVALLARAYNKPVLVCCETYKFSERVQTDSFVYNEIGDADLLRTTHTSETESPLSKTKDMNKLMPLNLLYDVTPPDLVTAVVTEIAILPCTSVPVVLRIHADEST